MICQDTDWDGGMGLNSVAEKDNKKQLIEEKVNYLFLLFPKHQQLADICCIFFREGVILV